VKPRERVICALSHKEPDRVPIAFGGGPCSIERDAYEDLKRYLNVTSETRTYVRDHVIPDDKILEMFDVDFRFVHIGKAKKAVVHIAHNTYIDEWGTTWKKPPPSLYFDMVDFPIKKGEMSELNEYVGLDTQDLRRYEGIREEAKRLRENTDFAVAADLICFGVFEQAWALRGFQNFLLDLAMNPKFAEALLEKIVEIQIQLYDRWLDALEPYIDVIMVSDDMGTQTGLMISPSMYRDMIKPYQKKLWRFIKDKTNAFLFLHCCGSIYPILNDFIEMGVDILNPIQPLAKDMDTKRLKAEFGDRFTFWGGVDTQWALPFGSREDVEKEVYTRIEHLSPGGGYILSPSHNIQYGVKPENIMTMFKAAKKYGAYGLKNK